MYLQSYFIALVDKQFTERTKGTVASVGCVTIGKMALVFLHYFNLNTHVLAEYLVLKNVAVL